MTQGRAPISESSPGGHVFGCVAWLALALATAACTGEPKMPASDPLAAQQRAVELPPPNVGQVRRVFGISTPLPEGDWGRVGEVTSEGNSPYPQRTIIWASTAAGVIDRLVVVWEQVGMPKCGESFEHCSDENYPHAVALRGPQKGNACWHIRPVSLGLVEDAPPQNYLIAGYAEKNDLVISPSMIGVRYFFSWLKPSRN